MIVKKPELRFNFKSLKVTLGNHHVYDWGFIDMIFFFFLVKPQIPTDRPDGCQDRHDHMSISISNGDNVNQINNCCILDSSSAATWCSHSTSILTSISIFSSGQLSQSLTI